jgi:hypothetical protein
MKAELETFLPIYGFIQVLSGYTNDLTLGRYINTTQINLSSLFFSHSAPRDSKFYVYRIFPLFPSLFTSFPPPNATDSEHAPAVAPVAEPPAPALSSASTNHSAI